MLYIGATPQQVQIQNDRKIIVLMTNKIIFTHLDFMEQYLSMPLISPCPKQMYYQPSVLQTLVVSQTTVEIYFCDWKTQIKLIKVIILNNQNVESVAYEKQSGWNLFGNLLQYQPAKVNFHRAREFSEQKILAKCVVSNSKYGLSEQKMQKIVEGQQPVQVNFKDRMMVLRNCSFSVYMKGAQTLDKKKDIICINGIYTLIVSHYEVLSMIVEPTIVYISNNLMISDIENGRFTTVQKFQNSSFTEIGTITKNQGDLFGAFLYEDEIVMLYYTQREIKSHSLKLVTENQGGIAKKGGRHKRIFQSISRIMEESHEEGSQILQKQESTITDSKKYMENSVNSWVKRKQSDYNGKSKPIVRQIIVGDDEIRDESLNQGNSEVLSRSGIQDSPHRFSHIDDQIQEDMSFQLMRQGKKTDFQEKDNAKSKNGQQNFEKKSLRKSLVEGQTSKQQLSNESKLNNSKRSQRNRSYNKNQVASNTSNISEHSVEVETPAFGFENNGFGAAGDRWNSFQRQRNDASNHIHEEQQVQEQAEEEMEESLCINDMSKAIMKFVPENISLKVQKFKPENATLTVELYTKIEKQSFCALVSKAIESEPDRIQQFLQLFLIDILNQPEAPLFFQKNIRTFNPQFTQDKIRRLFSSVIDRADLKQKMSSALQLFKLSQVPKQVLCFPNDFIKIMSILYKDIYIEDLLKPSETTIDYLLQSYFSIKNFPEEIVTIEDEQIDITHPRNMLNVLLYLNEYLNLKIDIIIKVYCTKILAEDHLDILRKITIKQNILQICEVSKKVLDEVVIERFNQLLNESTENAGYLWNLLEFLTENLMREYRIRLAIISEFNKCNVTFDISSFNKIKQSNFDILNFLQKVINENSVKNLVDLKIENVYRSMYWLQEGQKIVYATNQYIHLVQELAQKFAQKKLFYYAFNLLDSILQKVRTSFVARLLHDNLKCRFMNRLSEFTQNNLQSLRAIFPQLTSNPDIDISNLSPDRAKIPEVSKSFSCPWSKFVTIYEKHLNSPIQLKILTYSSINVANQLVLMSDQQTKRRFRKFLIEIQQHIKVQIKGIHQNDDSINPKGITSIRFDNTPKNQLQSSHATSTVNREDVLLLHQDPQGKKKTVYKSMTLIDHYNDVNNRLIRRNSDQKQRQKGIVDGNDDLMRIKLLVTKNQIIQELSEIYMEKGQQVFIQSLHLVDMQKIKLHHLDVFKAVVNKQVQFSLSKILPFQIFLTASAQQAFQLARSHIRTQISLKNFWLIYAIIELMFNFGNEICKILIQKCVMYYRSDQFAKPLSRMITQIRPEIDQSFMSKMLQSAKDYHLSSLEQVLVGYSHV